LRTEVGNQSNEDEVIKRFVPRGLALDLLANKFIAM
jgi:hypothetical protein